MQITNEFKSKEKEKAPPPRKMFVTFIEKSQLCCSVCTFVVVQRAKTMKKKNYSNYYELIKTRLVISSIFFFSFFFIYLFIHYP